MQWIDALAIYWHSGAVCAEVEGQMGEVFKAGG